MRADHSLERRSYNSYRKILRAVSTLIVLALGVPLFGQCTASNESESEAMTQVNTDNPQETAHAENGYTNRLIHEKSPYLLQHSRNPVDWYPWGEEAFAKAAAEDKPIFLSIGYSTCHWCHVMEHESFEDTAVARLMNEAFVCIKVDREERPDIDNIYMAVCQMMTGSGGWPLTVIMTPDRKPFFSGTYFPKTSRSGRVGMMELVPRIVEAWTTKRQELLNSAEQITASLNEPVPQDANALDADARTLRVAYEQLSGRFDPRNGGFGSSPKFPTPHNLLFLLRSWKRSGNARALMMVEKTLTEMRKGGMYDHVGFGFHRYSTDAGWLLPHFEKMLYDQALLAMAYTEAYLATGKTEYQTVAREIFTYVQRDMTDPAGGFYSAEDADSEGEEGKFYVWSIAEATELLGEEDAALVVKVYNFTEAGNFLEQATGQRMRTNIPHLKKPISELATELEMSEAELAKKLETIRKTMFAEREKRIHPYKDDKILTDWNGLMIAAFAKAARAFDEPEYAKAAAGAAGFVLKHLRGDDGRLIHRYREGEAIVAGNVDDYTFFIWGLIELYEATFDVSYLQTAVDLNEDLLKYFWDGTSGGLFFTADDAEKLITRTKESYDGAVPSGNSVGFYNLMRLGRITADASLEEMAVQIGRVFSSVLQRSPANHSQMLVGVDFAVGPTYEVILAADPDADDTRTMLRKLRSSYVPNKIVVLHPTNESSPSIVKLAEYTEGHESIDGKATAYVCRNYACQLPTSDATQMMQLLGVE